MSEFQPVADVLILGTAEWDSPIATNQHYVSRELARAATVEFVESLGLRTPGLNRADLSRMAGRLRRYAAAPGAEPVSRRPRPDHLTVTSPLIVPLHRAPTRMVNRTMLRRATARWLQAPRPRVLWTFTPVTYGLEAAADVVVYHCVDLLATFPGVDGVAVRRGEHALARGTTVAIATSQAVEEHLRNSGFGRIDLLPNVADVTVFAAAARPAAQRRPAVLFAGNLSPHKLDGALLEELARTLAGRAELLLAGPIGAGGGSFGPQLARLESLGARYVGMLPVERLAQLAGECTVGVIPYQLNDYTRGVSPLKCFEYLASGLAVASTPLPEVRQVAAGNPHIVVAQAADLPRRVADLIDPPTDEVVAVRIDSAATNGWSQRGQVLRDLLMTEVARAGRSELGVRP